MTRTSYTLTSGIALTISLFVTRAYAPLLEEQPSIALLVQLMAMPILCTLVGKYITQLAIREKNEQNSFLDYAQTAVGAILLGAWMYYALSKYSNTEEERWGHLVYFATITVMISAFVLLANKLFVKNKELKSETELMQEVQALDQENDLIEPQSSASEEAQQESTPNSREVITIAPKEELAESDNSTEVKACKNDNIPITIEGNTKESVTVTPKDLLYIKAEGNYIHLSFMDNEEVKYVMLRTNINATEKTLDGYSSIVRCHRSYIVNLKHVVGREGRPNGVTLLLKDGGKIPVSRSYDKEIRKAIKPKPRTAAN